MTEQWRPEKVDITKLKQQFFPYLKAIGLDPPPQHNLPLPIVTIGPRPKSTSADHWAQHPKRQKKLRDIKQLEANAIEQAVMQAMLDSGASKMFVNTHQGL